MKITNQNGLTLIEIMVALVIGLILTAGAIQLFIGNQQTYRSETALAGLQQNGRFVMETLAKDIRMIGYSGCTSRENITMNYIANATPPQDLTGNNAELAGSDAQGSGAWLPLRPAGMTTMATDMAALTQNTTDTLTIQRAHQCGAALTSTVLDTDNTVPIFAPNQCNFQANNPIMITDCTRTDIFQIDTNVTDIGPVENMTFSAAANTATKLSNTYETTSFVYRLLSNTYFIAPSQIDPTVAAANAEPAIWMARWNPDNTIGMQDPTDFQYVEIVDGIEDMQITYGTDTGGDEYAETYVTANNVLDWTTVRSIRISLLLRSADNITIQPQTIFFNGQNRNALPGPQDNRLRVVYSSTVSIRNQLK